MNLVLPTGVQPAKSSVESAVPLAPGDGRLVRAAGIEPNTSCLEDRHAAHYATPARMKQLQWTRKAPLQRSASAIRLAGSDRSRRDRPPASRDGGEYRDRTCGSRRTRRVSTALPYRSANSPIQMARGLDLEHDRARGRGRARPSQCARAIVLSELRSCTNARRKPDASHCEAETAPQPHLP